MAPVAAANWPRPGGHRRVGGRFWALADGDEANDDDINPPEVASPTPSDLICESIQIGYSEEQVAKWIDNVVPPNDCAWDGLGDEEDDRVEVLRRVVHRRTSASAVRPWKEPLPKQALGSVDEEDERDPMSKSAIPTLGRGSATLVYDFFPQLLVALPYDSFYFWLVVNQTAMH
ncbi:hypothetical protein ZWY2020_029978 [Hordeum vulgare]|nr:hypothetical protein ZWY2020_029978 [Hordeum vulgare]